MGDLAINGDGHPITEPVGNFLEVQTALIRPYISGRRNWGELLRGLFSQHYSDPEELERVVEGCVRRLNSNIAEDIGVVYVPVLVMERFREEQRHEQHCLLK